jgi:hypothetical protein
MSTHRRFEAACGVVAALFGLLGVAYVLFGPTYSFASSSGGGAAQTGTANVWQVGIEPITWDFLSLFVLGLIGVLSGAVLHSRIGAQRWRAVLWGSTMAMVAVTILARLEHRGIPAPQYSCCGVCMRALAAHETSGA